ncbi:LysR family transcriptional regulator [Rhizobium sp. TH2]|uniref:LysR substrate-binding domain-containing protein n=1 Tax=Rhizobium sp. TH2 TaxID=2775403 RepID=UPI00215801FE|nr:LysR substrate-binding domain-containing protein [Rhizobium sp. TH2]UVC10085.1 LysR family transcriptional regulator [Rhizobium sp. TH2]
MPSPLPPLRLLSVFEAVSRTGSVQRAAMELNVTQPAVSQALRQLEDHVGTKLLDRKTRPAARTEAGRILEVAVTEGLGRIADAIDHVRHLQMTGDSATVACSVGVATYWLMPRLARFSAEHPQVTVNVMTTLQGAPRLNPAVDLAIRYGNGRWADGTVEKLFDERVVPVCSQPFRDRLKSAGIKLDRTTLLHVNTDDPAWITWPTYLKNMGLPENRTAGRRFTNYVQATQAALDGQGVMLGWESITGDLVREGRLVELNDLPLVPADAFYLVTTPMIEERPSARLLASWLLDLP